MMNKYPWYSKKLKILKLLATSTWITKQITKKSKAKRMLVQSPVDSSNTVYNNVFVFVCDIMTFSLWPCEDMWPHS